MDFKLGALRVVSDEIQQAERQRKQSKIDALTALVERYRQAMPCATLLTDGTVVEANGALCQLLAKATGIENMPIDSLFKEPAAVKQSINKVSAGNNQQITLTTNGATLKTLKCELSLLGQDAGQAKYLLIATDITESSQQVANLNSKMDSVYQSQAIIEFDLTGSILNANDNFLEVIGYQLSEIQGRHHSIFVSAEDKLSTEYKAFWQDLSRGQVKSGEFKRKNRDGQTVWLRASYTPVRDETGNLSKVTKFAYDITAEKRQAADAQSQIDAIGKSQAVIEFSVTGEILHANANFLQAMGYSLAEVAGKHHSIFVDEQEKGSATYQAFWAELAKGKYQSGEFKRIHKSGQPVWIHASYNPIFDSEGNLLKVIKFAHDITEEKVEAVNYQSQINAISRAQAIIEFDLDGNILDANENFLGLMEYSLAEAKGKHHSIFVESQHATSSEYRDFWKQLAAGEFAQGEYKRLTKSGKAVWIQASYNPIYDLTGKPVKVIKYATDVTAQKLKNADFESQISAISRSQAVIEFDLGGYILSANDNFLSVKGYALDEIKGKHHSLFVEPEQARSPEYQSFWAKLASGEYQTGEYKRLGKDGKEVWIQAAYNPILDIHGEPVKVVKYASDVTEQKVRNANYRGQIKAIGQSQAVIEFELDGTIITANQNFLDAMGYSLTDVVGKHHNMFVEREVKISPEYREFWAKLARGDYHTGEYKRIGNAGKEVWIQASYNPILGTDNKPFKVVKYATDVTEAKLKNADYSSQLEAISKSQAVIEFDIEGNILDANQNFLDAMGYRLSEVKGRHHSIFVDQEQRSSQDYANFWQQLKSGEYATGEYKRIHKDGSSVWIQASYNPILDLNGKPFKVVKYATDISGRVNAVNAVSESISQLAQGNLDAEIKAAFIPEFDQLKTSINTTITQLKQTLEQIGLSAKEVVTGVGQIKSGNDDLSSRTEQQAATLEQTAASMEQMTSAVKNNANNSEQANQLSAEASSKAEAGGQIVDSAIQSMQSINEASTRISDIISVIDEIAFQTNLLALNAAVEAARAGEQGRGFAVVAGEVRSLAQRSAGAAKEIKELIQDSVAKVEEGTKLVNRSGDTLREIVESVNKVSGMVASITETAKEQSSGMTEINQSVTSMDSMTQQNAALVEQATAASQTLADEAQSMLDKLQFFQLGDLAVTPASPAPKVMPQAAQPVSTPKVTPIETAKKADTWSANNANIKRTPASTSTVSNTKTQTVVEISANQQDNEDEWEEF